MPGLQQERPLILLCGDVGRRIWHVLLTILAKLRRRMTMKDQQHREHIDQRHGNDCLAALRVNLPYLTRRSCYRHLRTAKKGQ